MKLKDYLSLQTKKMNANQNLTFNISKVFDLIFILITIIKIKLEPENLKNTNIFYTSLIFYILTKTLEIHVCAFVEILLFSITLDWDIDFINLMIQITSWNIELKEFLMQTSQININHFHHEANEKAFLASEIFAFLILSLS